jgi:serine/threonine protein kinase
LGEGTVSIVYEVCDKQGKRYALKIIKSSKNRIEMKQEEEILKKMDEFVEKIYNNVWIIKHYGKSLEQVWKAGDPFQDIHHAFVMGLEVIRKFHKKTECVHTDIKPDNFYVNKNSLLELHDYSHSRAISDFYNQDKFPAYYCLYKKYHKKYEHLRSFYDLWKHGIHPSYFNCAGRGNIFRSLHSFMYDDGHFTTGDDIESFILCLWDHYSPPLPWDNDEIGIEKMIEFRLNPNVCPIPLLRFALVQLRKNFSLTVDEFYQLIHR